MCLTQILPILILTLYKLNNLVLVLVLVVVVVGVVVITALTIQASRRQTKPESLRYLSQVKPDDETSNQEKRALIKS